MTDTLIPTEDHSANILPPEQQAEPSEAVLEGQRTAEQNTKAERKASSSKPDVTLTEDDPNIKSAQHTAEVNAKAENDARVEGYGIAKNDTSKAGKIRATKAQLDPTGDDPISSAEIERAATDGTKVRGGTSVSDEENAERAQHPGKVEEESPQSLAGDGVDPEALQADPDAVHANKNENENTGEGGMADIAGSENRTVDGRDNKLADATDDTPAEEDTSTPAADKS